MRYLSDLRHVASAQLRPHHSEKEDVLPTVVDTCATDTETRKSSAVADPRHVYGTLPDRLLPRAQALHHLQLGVPRRCLPNLLQWQWQLPAVEHKLRYSKMRQRLKSRSSQFRFENYPSLVVGFFPLPFIFRLCLDGTFKNISFIRTNAHLVCEAIS